MPVTLAERDTTQMATRDQGDMVARAEGGTGPTGAQQHDAKQKSESEPTEMVEEVKELTEEEIAELAIREKERTRKRQQEVELLYELGYKLTPSEVSDIKIHIMIDMPEWKRAMTGHDLMVYLDELSRRDPKPSIYSPGKFEQPPEFTAKKIGNYLFRLGKKELSNEARCIEILTSMDHKVKEGSTVESFFQSLLAQIANEGEYKPLFIELQYMTRTNPTYIGQILEDLAEESFFQRKLIEFCATLDHKGLFKWRTEIQDRYILSFNTRYTEEEFQDIFLKLARETAATEPQRQAEEYDD